MSAMNAVNAPVLTRRPPTGRLGRTVPIAATIIRLWLEWRWLRIKRRMFGIEAMQDATHRFHRQAALAVFRRAIRQQGPDQAMAYAAE